ncbi:MAG TPA: acylphosphatase [Jiangellaceae bacterium]|nr:acylphosphatase [Jiangellaceae bacterium]
MSDVRCRAIVTGRVQGVFYRDSCQQMARRLGVRGSVRNRHDGAVEVVAEGDRDAVGALLAWCREGPPRASVTAVAITDEEPVGETSFRVVH